MTISAVDRLEVHHHPLTETAPESTDAPSAPSGMEGGGVVAGQASGRPTFTITDAATACSVSRKTITRKLPELAGHGAAKDDDGVWRIPVEALLAVGLHPGRSLPEGATGSARPIAPPSQPARPAESDTVTIARDRWDDVRIRLARAEAEAAERGLALADARLALRALTAGPVAPVQAVSGARADATATTGRADAGTVGAYPSSAATARPDHGAASVPQSAPSGPVGPAESITSGDVPAGSGAAAAPMESGEMVSADIVAARNLAARTGGYVPAGTTPEKRRRWWRSR